MEEGTRINDSNSTLEADPGPAFPLAVEVGLQRFLKYSTKPALHRIQTSPSHRVLLGIIKMSYRVPAPIHASFPYLSRWGRARAVNGGKQPNDASRYKQKPGHWFHPGPLSPFFLQGTDPRDRTLNPLAFLMRGGQSGVISPSLLGRHPRLVKYLQAGHTDG